MPPPSDPPEMAYRREGHRSEKGRALADPGTPHVGKLLLDQFGRNIPFLGHIEGRGDEDPHELRRDFAHIPGVAPGRTPFGVELIQPLWLPVSRLSSSA